MRKVSFVAILTRLRRRHTQLCQYHASLQDRAYHSPTPFPWLISWQSMYRPTHVPGHISERTIYPPVAPTYTTATDCLRSGIKANMFVERDDFILSADGTTFLTFTHTQIRNGSILLISALASGHRTRGAVSVRLPGRNLDDRVRWTDAGIVILCI